MLDISGKPGSCIAAGMGLGMCIGACMAEGEGYERAMLWGFEY